MKSLILFTNAFPFSDGENWIFDEISFLSKNFKVTIVPLVAPREAISKWNLPTEITVMKPLFHQLPEQGRPSFRDVLRIFNNRIPVYLSELIRNHVFFDRNKIFKFLQFVRLAQTVTAHPTIKNLLTTNPATLFYFYWGLGTSQMIPFLNRNTITNKIAVRMHGYDLYEYRNSGYIPFRKKLLKKSDMILPVSENGKKYLTEMYPEVNQKIIVARLGTFSAGLAAESNNNSLHIVSCSSLIPLKRVHLIAEALQHADIPVNWTHIGSGPELQRIQELITVLPDFIRVNFKGHVSPTEIGKLYASATVDLFLHVSETEGVPVAVMEALAAGVPVYATNVGGVPEIVDSSVGKLLPADIAPTMLAKHIREFYSLQQEEKKRLRRQAFERYQQSCDAANNAATLSALLESLD